MRRTIAALALLAALAGCSTTHRTLPIVHSPTMVGGYSVAYECDGVHCVTIREG